VSAVPGSAADDATTRDRLTLTGLRANAFHGVFEHERINGQLFVIDVVVHLSLAEAGGSDRLAQTIHYGELAEAVVGAVERDPVDLIETVAERIASLVLEQPRAELVEVTVHKPSAPITVPFDDVSVTIIRSRSTEGGE
jgi:dihydroneopterin aldolase